MKTKDSSSIKRILVLRFRQIGDSILAAALCSTLKRTFLEARIDFVLNKGIAPLFEGHPDIDRVIAFDRDELKSTRRYVAKVWRTVREGRYDVIIDMRSTTRTLLFSLFSLRTPWRIGRRKKYAFGLLTHQVDNYSPTLHTDMVQRDLMLAEPLSDIADIDYTDDFRLYVTDGEREDMRRRMATAGIDFNRPVWLIGVTTKIADKRWRTDYMTEMLRRLMAERPELQFIFNYAPGQEEDYAREAYEALGRPSVVKIDVEARSLRELAALTANCDFYFGNEGGARHLAHALGKPSFVVCSPFGQPDTWIPRNAVAAMGISADDVTTPAERAGLTPRQTFDLLTPDAVYPRLQDFLQSL